LTGHTQLRQEALRVLEEDSRLSERMIYLLDVLPLVEMLWADGRCQQAERILIDEYLREHVAWLNAQVPGSRILEDADIDRFVAEFIERRPPAALLDALSEFAYAQHASGRSAVPDSRERVIDFSLDIASAAVTTYPFGPHERFEPEEKKIFMKLVRRLLQ
jgi:hypothetical protein